MNIAPLSRTENIVVQQMTGEVLIYDLKTNKAFCLNETSALVWELCDGKTHVPDIGRKISRKLKKPVSEDLVWLALDQLESDSLLENGSELNNYFSELSRREIIRKVGFASVVALPMVSSLVAPEASMAQSAACFANLVACTTGADCCSGACIISPGVGGSLTCCNAPTADNGSGSMDIDRINCPVGAPCDGTVCNTTASGICCSGLADPVTTNCVTLAGGVTQRCQCNCL